MTKNEIVEHLKNSTVKIDNVSRVGTGFFIADKLIATCYHNIKGHSKYEHKVYWQREAYSITSIEINQDDDLALLEIKIDKKHPILQIDESVEVGDECQSFGYSRKNGDVITFEYEGKDGDGRLKFKEGLFQSGLSGGAILNFRTHKICGIVKSKRDNTESVALGGRGIPISKLFGFKSLDIDDNGSIFSKKMFKNWVWTSSVESADKLQFSILALVETLVAVGVSLFVWIYYGFYWHIVVGLIIAPLFLLQTKESIIATYDYIDIFLNVTKDKTEAKSYQILSATIVVIVLLITIFLSYLYFGIIGIVISITLYILLGSISITTDTSLGETTSPLVGLLFFIFIIALIGSVSTANFVELLTIPIFIKFFVTLKFFSINSIKKLPENWFKLILAKDITYPPELFYDIEKTNYAFKFSILKREYLKQKGLRKQVFLLGIIIIFMPTLIFRYSLKSTAWIYLPLIWLIQPQDKQNLTTRLKIESKNFIAYFMFLYSLIVVFVFTFLPIFFPNFIEAYTHNLPQQLELIFFAYPSNFHYEYGIWYFTRFFSALITIVFIFSFTKILIRRETEPSYGDFWGAKLLSLRTVRSVLTLVTLGFTAYHIFGLLPDSFFMDLWHY